MKRILALNAPRPGRLAGDPGDGAAPAGPRLHRRLRSRQRGRSTTLVDGRLPLFRYFDEHGNRLACPHTLLIDSEELDSGEALDRNFRAAAGDEIELPEERLTAKFDDDATLELTPPDRRTAPARWGPILVAGSRRRRSRWL